MDEFKVGDKAKVIQTGLVGNVIGVGDFKAGGRQYLVEYSDSTGRLDSRWFQPDEIAKEAGPA